MIRGMRQRLIGLAVLAVTFIAGGVAGAAVRELTADDPPAVQRVRSDDDRDNDRNRRRFPYEYLEVTPEQRTQLEAVFEHNREAMSAVWSEYKPRYEAVVDSTRAAVNRVLTPEQRQKFEEYRDRKNQNRRESSERSDGDRDGAKP